MKTSRTTWQSKLDRVQEYKIVDGGKRFEGTMVVPTPRQIESLVKEIPTAAVTNSKLIRMTLANRLGAGTTCPLCTGIFLRITAEAAEEQRALGNKEIAPYWRVVDAKGRHNPKYPGGSDGQDALLASEINERITA